MAKVKTKKSVRAPTLSEVTALKSKLALPEYLNLLAVWKLIVGKKEKREDKKKRLSLWRKSMFAESRFKTVFKPKLVRKVVRAASPVVGATKLSMDFSIPTNLPIYSSEVFKNQPAIINDNLSPIRYNIFPIRLALSYKSVKHGYTVFARLDNCNKVIGEWHFRSKQDFDEFTSGLDEAKKAVSYDFTSAELVRKRKKRRR